MTSRRALSKELSFILVDLFNDTASMRVFASYFGLNIKRINWNSSVHIVSWEIVQQSIRQDLIQQVAQTLSEDPDYLAVRRAAVNWLARWRSAPPERVDVRDDFGSPPPPPPRAPSVEEMMLGAASLMRSAQFGRAREVLQQILERRPSSADAHYRIAICHLDGLRPYDATLRKVEAAQRSLALAIQQDPKHGPAQLLMQGIDRDSYVRGSIRNPYRRVVRFERLSRSEAQRSVEMISEDMGINVSDFVDWFEV